MRAILASFRYRALRESPAATGEPRAGRDRARLQSRAKVRLRPASPAGVTRTALPSLTR
ncbi:MAG TPA: hypothetical protein VGF77_09275 [Allosphingosinicella sp.]